MKGLVGSFLGFLMFVASFYTYFLTFNLGSNNNNNYCLQCTPLKSITIISQTLHWYRSSTHLITSCYFYNTPQCCTVLRICWRKGRRETGFCYKHFFFLTSHPSTHIKYTLHKHIHKEMYARASEWTFTYSVHLQKVAATFPSCQYSVVLLFCFVSFFFVCIFVCFF